MEARLVGDAAVGANADGDPFGVTVKAEDGGAEVDVVEMEDEERRTRRREAVGRGGYSA